MSTSKERNDVEETTVHWHSMTGDEVLAKMSVDGATGLSEDEIASRRAASGANEFTQAKPVTVFERLFAQLKSPLTAVLVAAFVLTFALQEYVDASVIAIALLIAVVVGVIQEGRASEAFKKLADSQQHIAQVLRGGKKFQIPSAEVVVGDIVLLESGMQVPADMRLLHTKNLSINESTLIGEWLAVDKETEPVLVGVPFAEQASMAWMGTFVAAGQGYGVVVATGDATAVGRLADGLRDVKEEQTPLQREMARVSTLMLYLILLLVSIIFLIGVLEGQELKEMLLMSVAIAVASVPEGLPAAITIILAVGMEALLKRGGLVRNLLAAETLGSTTFVLTDKTGTLTEGKMAVAGVMVDHDMHLVGKGWQDNERVAAVINHALNASNAFFDEAAGVTRGDPVEAAILEMGEVVSGDHSLRTRRLDFLPFTSEQRFAAGLAPRGEGGYILSINGAPEALLDAADSYYCSAGERPLSSADRTAITDHIDRETKQGRRLVAVGYKVVDYDDIPNDGSGVLEHIVFAGVIVFSDPVRDGVAEAIAGVQSAGARILLITGDNPATAGNVAAAVGIAKEGARVISGDDLSKLSDEEILAAIDGEVSVFARVLPKQKLRIAQLLQRRGEIVAMTGDGINDAPALRKANIGVAIGSGTEVAKEASDLVLVNDTFETIYAAIEEGRRITTNLKKIVGYLLSTSLSEVVLIGAALLTGAAAPITAAQILWANVIEEGFMSVAFAFEKGDKDLMKDTPQDIHEEGILSRQMIFFMAFVITVLSSLTLSLYFYFRLADVPFEELRSVMFLSISIDSLFIAFAFRSLKKPVWQISLRTNMFFVGSFLVSASLLVMVVTVPFFHTFLSYTPLPLFDMMLILAVSVASLITIEFGKLLFFQHHEKMVK